MPEKSSELPMVLPIETARELALVAACSEWRDLNGSGDISLPDKFVREFPWGWIFESALMDSENDDYAGVCVSVDRFSGKTQIIAGAAIANDDWPLLELTLIEIGIEKNAVFQIIRELTGWNSSDTMQRMRDLPIVVAVGPMMSIRSINEALLTRGAATSIARKTA
jgi:hypothetical protein